MPIENYNKINLPVSASFNAIIYRKYTFFADTGKYLEIFFMRNISPRSVEMAMTTQQSLSSILQDSKMVSSASSWSFMLNVYPATQCFSVQMKVTTVIVKVN